MKIRTLFTCLMVYLIFLSLELVYQFIVYSKTGVFALTKENFISPIVPSVILIALHLFLLEFLSEDKDKK